MTPITKTVKRRTVGSHRGRRIVVSLHPGDVLGFREERTRKEYTVLISSAYIYAVRLEVERRAREKREARGRNARKFYAKRGML